MSAVLNKSPKANELAKIVENDYAKYSVLKDMKKVFEEYLELLATGKDPVKAQKYRTYIIAGFTKNSGYRIESRVKEAISKGSAHELGQDLLNNVYLDVKNKNGETERVLLNDHDNLVYDMVKRTIRFTDILKAATIINSIAIGSRVMKAISSQIDFNKLKTCDMKELPQLVGELKLMSQFISGLNLSKDAQATALRNAFNKNIINTVKELMAANKLTLAR